MERNDMRVTLRLATAALATAGMLGGFAAPVQAANSNQRIMAAIHGVNDLLAAPVAGARDANSLAQTSDVDVRRDGTLAIRTANAGDIVITLPNASQARGARIGNDAVFAGPRSSTFVRPAPGGAQVAMIAPNRHAPTDYTFTVQNGSVAAGPQGSLLLFDAKGAFNRVVPAPWARDAARKPVPTNYNVAPGGTAFTQQVAHRRSGVTYPVVADPVWIPAWVLLACGAGWALGSIGYWISGGADARQAFGSGVVGCISWILGKRL